MQNLQKQIVGVMETEEKIFKGTHTATKLRYLRYLQTVPEKYRTVFIFKASAL